MPKICVGRPRRDSAGLRAGPAASSDPAAAHMECLCLIEHLFGTLKDAPRVLQARPASSRGPASRRHAKGEGISSRQALRGGHRRLRGAVGGQEAAATVKSRNEAREIGLSALRIGLRPLRAASAHVS